MDKNLFTPETLRSEADVFFATAKRSRSLRTMRERLAELALQLELDIYHDYERFDSQSVIRVRDCSEAFRGMLRRRSEDFSGFSVAQAIMDIGRGKPRPDLTPAFYADLYHIMTGIMGQGRGKSPEDLFLEPGEQEGREAAIKRSSELDELWSHKVTTSLAKYQTGLQAEVVERRARRKARILKALGGGESDWNDFSWQFKHIARKVEDLEDLVELTDSERKAIRAARAGKLPFGVTPYYLSLMDDEPTGLDRAIRAQVFPPLSYVERIAAARAQGERSLDFMLEGDTSPVDLITRRYPGIAIFKPFNACPQICVYCQRNWEIDEPMGAHALATPQAIEEALDWIEAHPAIHELLITGGDPLALPADKLEKILKRVARIKSLEAIRIGSRTLVTAPMRITGRLADFLGGLREPGRRSVAVVTHVQHPYEITPDTAAAVNRLRLRGISVYNQLVYTFYVSRRFEAAALRKALRLVGIDPYYAFSTKGKDETRDYWVPLARILQEQKEEARLLPGLSRTDEAVFNVPGLGKTYLRARQHRELISLMPDGSRVYEFHPWEKNISKNMKTYIGRDLPILEYLEKLETIGEDPDDYGTIWHYF